MYIYIYLIFFFLISRSYWIKTLLKCKKRKEEEIKKNSVKIQCTFTSPYLSLPFYQLFLTISTYTKVSLPLFVAKIVARGKKREGKSYKLSRKIRYACNSYRYNRGEPRPRSFRISVAKLTPIAISEHVR